MAVLVSIILIPTFLCTYQVSSFHTTSATFSRQRGTILSGAIRLYAITNEDDSDDKQSGNATPSNISSSSSTGDASNNIAVVDDGMTDRFKYKVHALMGSYDPPSGTIDDDKQMGNIIGALLQFPTEYTFSVVGKTTDSDDYTQRVTSVFRSVLGSDAQLETRIVPRGKKFTRVSVKVNVESAPIIENIYAELDALEATVMKF